MLSNKQVEQFKNLFKDSFGEELSDTEALEKGTKLIRLFQIIYKPMTQKELEIVQKRVQEIN